MKTTSIILALCLLAGGALAQGMGTSGGHDLDQLWARAQKNHDLAQEDAVLLLESRTVTVDDEGSRVTRVHRVAWVGTSLGIRGYADLRVPWNSATSTLDVEILRTWMDGRWWPDAQRISETAVVHTLPYAVDHADDYTVMRETMLLHDGVELPCIMETAYTIAEQGLPTAGADDLFVMAQRDPAVRVEYALRVPTGMEVRHAALNGAPEAGIDENGVQTLTWRLEDVAPLRLPIADQPAAYEPALVWSTWESWQTLEDAWSEACDSAAVLGPAVIEALEESLAGSLDPVRDTVAFWNESVRAVHYPFRFWQLAPRSATRTWETGYGHALDRAVLLAALLQHVAGGDGPAVSDCLLHEPGYGETAPTLPRLAGFDGVTVYLQPNRHGSLLVDADAGRILSAPADDRWMPWTRSRPALLDDQLAGHLSLSLAPGEGEAWEGSGNLRMVRAHGLGLEGDADALQAHIAAAVRSVLPDAEISAPAPSHDGYRFAVSLAAWPTNADGESTLTVGPLAGGVLDRLPADVHLFEAARQSPVRFPADLAETVDLQLRVGDAVVRTPEPVAMESVAGRFTVDVSRAHGWLRVERSLDLRGEGRTGPRRVRHPASAWPELRSLLLEAGDPVHGTIVLE
jgi:hypothetical protein